LTVFNYETPKFLKQSGKNGELNKLMGKIYEPDRIVDRISMIVVAEAGKSS
jgi:hypothetical protein